MTSSWRIFSSLSRVFLLSSPTLSSMMVFSFFSFSSCSLQISSSIADDDHDVNGEWRFGLHTATFLLTFLCNWFFFPPFIIKKVTHSFSIALLLLLPPGAGGLLKLRPATLLQTFLKETNLSFNLLSVLRRCERCISMGTCEVSVFILTLLRDHFIFSLVLKWAKLFSYACNCHKAIPRKNSKM